MTSFAMHAFSGALIAFALALGTLSSQPAGAQVPLGEGFPYRRSNIKINNVLRSGTFGVRFKLFNAPTQGNRIGPAIAKTGVNIAAADCRNKRLSLARAHSSARRDGSKCWRGKAARHSKPLLRGNDF